MNETNVLILINNIMGEYAEALNDLQFCATNCISKTEARAKLDVYNSIISKALDLEINECVRHDEKYSFIGIWKYNDKGKIISNKHFPVNLGIDFILNALKFKLLEVKP